MEDVVIIEKKEDVKREVCDEGGGGGGGGGGVGRLVDSSQAEDRRLIQLVRERRLLYARNNMPVASYYAQCKQHWQEVADHMGRSVAEVRRKWSHIRNSYSRHLRNEVAGARTGRGRAVSRWYLADELDFLRDHMATDTRSPSFSRYELPLSAAVALAGGAGDSEGEGGGGWPPAGGAALHWKAEPAVEAVYAASEDGSSLAEDETSFVTFFRGLQADWLSLSAGRRRLYLRQCLAQLHALLDEQDAASPPASPLAAAGPRHPLPLALAHAHSILPNS